MPDKKDDFTLEDSDRMIKDKIDSYFQRLNVTHDIEELGEVKLAGGQEGEEIPPGYHRMPDTGELMLDSEMV